MTFAPIYPLYEKQHHGSDTDDLLPITDFDATWTLLIICGIFFIFGSLSFARAFDEPPQKPLFSQIRHFQTDELMGTWFYLLGMLPFIPYMFIFYIRTWSIFYLTTFVGSIFLAWASYLGVVSCYPSEQKHENNVMPLLISTFGAQMWIVKHLSNDWIAGTWIIYLANVLLTVASFLLFLIAWGVNNAAGMYTWGTG